MGPPERERWRWPAPAGQAPGHTLDLGQDALLIQHPQHAVINICFDTPTLENQVLEGISLHKPGYWIGWHDDTLPLER